MVLYCIETTKIPSCFEILAMKKQSKFYIIWLVGTIFVSLLFSEVGLRLYSHFSGTVIGNIFQVQQNQFRPSEIKGLYHELKPQINSRARINSYGFRSEPFEQKKDANEVRVFIVGDSVPYGFLLSQEESIAYRLSEIVAQRYATQKYHFINAAVPSYNATQILAAIDNKIPPFQPDLYIVYLNQKDLDPPGIAPRQNQLFGYLYRYSFIFKTIVISTPLKSSIRFTDAQYQNWNYLNYQAITEICRRSGLHNDKWLIVLHSELFDDPIRGNGRQYRKMITMLTEHKVNFIQSKDSLLKAFDSLKKTRVTETDPIHLNTEATVVLAQAIVDRMIETNMLNDIQTPAP